MGSRVLRAALACCLATETTFAASIQVPAVTSNQTVQVHLIPPFYEGWVMLSQDPDFGRTNGVRIQLTSLHSNLDVAQLSVTYPNGRPGGHSLPAALPSEHRDVRILAVLARLSDGGEIPPYATSAWLERLMFSDTQGVDNRGQWNNVKAYWEQNSYGRIRITGAAFPEWVTLPASSNYVSRTEFLAGTNPTNALSSLQLTLRRNPQANLSFPTVLGRSYVLETTRDAGRSHWYPFFRAEPLPGNGGVMSLGDYHYQNSGVRFYRVRLAPE